MPDTSAAHGRGRPLSAYLEPRHDEYYARLLAVPTDGDWPGWLTFFLGVVEHQARDAVTRAQWAGGAA